MISYPASCDHLVARPPTYDESMNHFLNNQNRTQVRNRTELHTRTQQHNRTQNNRRRQITREDSEEYIDKTGPLYYPPRRLHLRQRLCNIL